VQPRGAGIRTSKDQQFFLNTMANIGQQMIDSTDALNEQHHFSLLVGTSPRTGERGESEITEKTMVISQRYDIDKQDQVHKQDHQVIGT
jgi:hypothetical protein